MGIVSIDIVALMLRLQVKFVKMSIFVANRGLSAPERDLQVAELCFR